MLKITYKRKNGAQVSMKPKNLPFKSTSQKELSVIKQDRESLWSAHETKGF